MTRTTSQSILHWATRRPDAIAVIDAGLRRSYAQFARDVVRCVSLLRDRGVRQGMVVGIQCDQRATHLCLMIACEVIGAASASFTTLDLANGQELAASCDVICHEMPTGPLRAVGQIMIAIGDVARAIAQPADEEVELAVLDSTQPAERVGRLIKTSGTTGRSKTIPHHFGALAAKLALHLHHQDATGIDGIELVLYNFTLPTVRLQCMRTLAVGRLVVFTNVGDMVAGLDTMPPFTVNVMASEAAKLAERCASAGRLARFGSIQVGGGRLPPELRRMLLAHVATHVDNSYSTVETGRVALVGEDGAAVPLPGVAIRIVDDALRDVAPGAAGTIAIR